MKKIIITFFVSCYMFDRYTFADNFSTASHVEGYSDVTIRLNKASDSASYENILKYAGVFQSENSKVVLHEEDNYVDITCFSCIVRDNENGEYIQQPDNDIHAAPNELLKIYNNQN